jgi:hypothetical protein
MGKILALDQHDVPFDFDDHIDRDWGTSWTRHLFRLATPAAAYTWLTSMVAAGKFES